jgi:hypothetical protein
VARYPTDAAWFDIPVFNWHAGRLSCIYVRQYIESAQRNFLPLAGSRAIKSRRWT